MANRFITKRNGTQEPFKQSKVDAALANAFNSCGYLHIPKPLYDKYQSIDFNDAFSVEDVQDKL